MRAAEPVPTVLPQYAWTYAESPVFDWNRARVLDWHRNFWRLVPKVVFEQPFGGSDFKLQNSGLFSLQRLHVAVGLNNLMIS